MSKTEFNQELSSAKANADYLLKTEDDLITGILSLGQGSNLNTYISDLQGHLYTIADIIGVAGEADPNAKIYTSVNYVANGDDRKVAISKLDAQAKINADNIAGNLVLIGDNAAAIQAILDSIGVANGICPLDANAKIPSTYLPDVLLEYKGIWDADTNTPTLADGTGELNDWYRVDVAGTVDLGSGSISYAVGDKVVHNGTIWQKWDTTESVISVNSMTGAVVLDKTHIGLANVTDDAQLKRSAGDWPVDFPEKESPSENDVVLIEDSDDSQNKRTVKLINLLGSGGGGGGGSFAWELNKDISPLESIVNGISTLDFDYESGMAISALLVVPSGYREGKHIAIENTSFFSEGTADNVLFKTVTTLFKAGEDVTSDVNSNSSALTETTLSTANELLPMGIFELTDSAGKINGNIVESGDILKIELYRDIDNETSSSLEDARMLKYSSTLNFDYETDIAPPIGVLIWNTSLSSTSPPTITAISDSVSKAGGTNYSPDNNSRTSQEVASGNLFVQVTVPIGFASGGARGRIGLQNPAPPVPAIGTGAHTVMDYQLYIRGTVLRVHEGTGSIAQNTTVADGDVVRIEISGSDVIYSKNGTPFRTVSGATLNYPYGAGCVMDTQDTLNTIEFDTI